MKTFRKSELDASIAFKQQKVFPVPIRYEKKN